jgi:hypothetical protein
MDQADIRTSITSSDFRWAACAADSWPSFRARATITLGYCPPSSLNVARSGALDSLISPL